MCLKAATFKEKITFFLHKQTNCTGNLIKSVAKKKKIIKTEAIN